MGRELPISSDAPNRVILHVGPPKTATTALQLALQASEGAGYFYGGVTQPRRLMSRELSARLHRYASQPDPKTAKELRDEIEAVLGSAADLVISEEMFLVDTRVPHQEKLRRIGDLLSDFPVSVIVCVRDPVAGLQSLYQELLKQKAMPPLHSLSFASFLRGNQAKVFDYGHVRDMLHCNGLRNVRFIDFSSLTSGAVTFDALLGSTYQHLDLKITMENISEVSESWGRNLEAVKVAQTLKAGKWLPRSWVQTLKKSQAIGAFWARVQRVDVLPKRNRKLQVPHSMARYLRDQAARVF